MQGKRFVAPNMRLALKMVREALGPEAVILSNRQVPGGVELLTAIDSPVVADTIEERAYSTPAHFTAPGSDNPFVQTPDNNAREAIKQPSKLEAEVERMRQGARQRAQQLAASLAKKYQDQQVSDELVSNTQALHTSIQDCDVSVAQFQAANNTNTRRSIEQTTTESSSDQQSLELGNGDKHSANEQVSTSVTSNKLTVADINADCTGQPASSDELTKMRNEMQSMRDLLEQQLNNIAWGQYNYENPHNASQWRRLKRMGIAAEVASTLIGPVERGADTPDSWQSIMASLCRRLPVAAKDIVADGGIFAFVGPTGAGKTTTIGKLAAQYVLKHGADDVALVTLDTMRIAAQEQLRTLARILKVPVKVVDKNNSLANVLYSLRHKSLVLIDTAGLNPSSQQLTQQLNALNEVGEQLKTLLVIPTTAQAQLIKVAFHAYKTDNLAACILTKLDETTSIGEAMCLCIEKNLPIAYSTDGQNIPQDIAVADKLALVKTAIDLAKETEVDDQIMADELATLAKAR